ncbi:MAG: winged helix-turn-helix transcriptional regulator [Deltaproteobacteria bacterium]|nr:winged helix-turn-helix transcriptional regulator [Deltaproteobacteria bacterium]
MKKSTKRLPPLSPTGYEELERGAAIAKCLANPKRLGIIEALAASERTVGDLARHLGIASQVVSVELRIMKELGAVAARREHPEVYYKLADPRLSDAARLLRQVAEQRVKNGGPVPLSLSRNKTA